MRPVGFSLKNQMAHIRDNFITCVLFKGTTKTKILDRKDFKSDLFSNYKDAFRFLQQHLRFEYIIRDGGPRKEISEIPLEVLREGLVNAIVHRDYYEEGAGIDAFYRLEPWRGVRSAFDSWKTEPRVKSRLDPLTTR